MGSSKVKILKDIFLNFVSNGIFDLTYVVEPANWSIKWDGKYITENLNKLNLLKARISTSHLGLKNQIIHFGSFNTFFTNKGFKKVNPLNKVIVTCFHLVPDDPRLNFIKKASKYKNILLHTSAYITKRKLIELGVPEEKIIVIPLGVDLGIFKPVSEKRKKDLKRVLGILEGRIVIGSFQKDGVGWDEGLEPKLVKGPDIFIKVIEKLSKEYPIFVLLVGPSRGYVKKNLEKLRIPYKNIGYLSNYKEVAKYYHALDLYLITSRIEGGPKQILEAWASGVPVVTTKVGMVPDIARNGENALLAEVEDIQQITSKTKKIIENKELRRKLIMNGLKTVQSFSWGTIAKKYYEEIYLKLLKKRKS